MQFYDNTNGGGLGGGGDYEGRAADFEACHCGRAKPAGFVQCDKCQEREHGRRKRAQWRTRRDTMRARN